MGRFDKVNEEAMVGHQAETKRVIGEENEDTVKRGALPQNLGCYIGERM
jgi:hypothetical protein